MDEAEVLCDRVAIVDHGRIIAQGTPRELIRSLGADHVIEFTVTGESSLDRAALPALAGARHVREDNGTWALTASHLHVVLPALVDLVSRSGGDLASLMTHNATLEDVFVSLTGRHLRDE
jgi:ABC-2 type transport system ATP-binding protein